MDKSEIDKLIKYWGEHQFAGLQLYSDNLCVANPEIWMVELKDAKNRKSQD